MSKKMTETKTTTAIDTLFGVEVVETEFDEAVGLVEVVVAAEDTVVAVDACVVKDVETAVIMVYGRTTPAVKTRSGK